MATTTVSPNQNQGADYAYVAFITLDLDDHDEHYALEIGMRDGAWSIVSRQVDAAFTTFDNGDGVLVAEVRDQVSGPDPLTALLALVRGRAA